MHVYSIPHNHYKVTVDMYLGVFMWTEIPNSQIHIPSVTDWLFDQLIVEFFFLLFFFSCVALQLTVNLSEV